MLYNSTRDKTVKLTPSLAILKGLSDDGGLFVPEKIPELGKTIEELKELDYRELAYEIMKLYFDDFTKEELQSCINSAYDEKFDTPEIAPMVYADGAYYLELFHGRTIAFKDMALSILPYLMTASAKKNAVEDKILILTATSGDTGKAALEGFADVPGTSIMVFYPKDGVSRIQKLQMVTQKGENTSVVGVNGNFDDCQNGVKSIFNDTEFLKYAKEKGYRLSSANSINIGRLVPQIVYYFHAYLKLLKEGKINDKDRINICVPTGNFGNILAGYYAKNMGLPVNKLICASNDNKVLYDFFGTGKYDKNREFILTVSPSMDILISSNLERLLYHISGNDTKITSDLMEALKTDGKYEITEEMKKGISCFEAGFATEEETFEEIKKVYEDTGYVLDTHTAVASKVLRKLKDGFSGESSVVVSTASPYKFAGSVLKALDRTADTEDVFDLIEKLKEISGVEIPEAVKSLKDAPIRHEKNVEIADMKKAVEDIVASNG